MPRANLASLLDNTHETPATDDGQQSKPPGSGEGFDAEEAAGVRPTSRNSERAASERHVTSLPDSSSEEGSLPATPAPQNQQDAPAVARSVDQAVSTLPRYLQLERKELRVRVDQADDLARLTRRLNRARRGAGDRITDNTLIRVAIDLLLQQSDRLAGSTESELRNSVGA